MGLDTVELVLAIEKEFEVGIDDADAANLATPRLLADYIAGRLGIGHSGANCHFQATFHRIRGVLIEQFGASRKDVRPDAPIQRWLNGDTRRQWHELTAALGATHLPPLECSKNIYYPVALGFPLMCAPMLLLQDAPLWAPILAFFFLWLAAHLITDRMADIVPAPVSTVASLVPYIRPASRAEWTHDYVLQRVIQIAAAQTGRPAGAIHPDDHFVKAIGLG